MEQLFNVIKADQTFFIQLALVVILLAILLGALYMLIGQKRWHGYGKIIGFILGYFIARAPGALLGLLAGHTFDLYILPKRVRRPRVQQVRVERNFTRNWFFNDTLFSILGNLAHASGNVTTVHLNQFHTIAELLQLDGEEQRQAWEWFQYGQHKDFNVRQALFAFTQHVAADQQQAQSLMRQSINFAEKIQPLNAEQYAILCNVAFALHFSTDNFAHLAPPQQGAQDKQTTNPETGEIYNPYKLLGLETSASNKEVKWAYRKLMGRYHPDKLISKDLPEDLIQLATKRTQEIKDAYEKICQARGI
jgi:DnaJ like chaperone protein